MADERLGEIRRIYNEGRGPLPRADEVRERANRRRALSITRPRGRVRLNVARAVVEAGPEAWRLIAPTLRREPGPRRRFREMVSPAMAAAAPASSRRPPPRTAPCQGTPHERRVLEAMWAWAEARFGHSVPFPSPVRLRVSRRMTRTYGSAAWKGDRYELALGAQLFRAGCEEVLLDTFLHELAHLVDMAERGRTDHGPRWKGWARHLGADPTRLLAPERAAQVAAAAGAGPCAIPGPVLRHLPLPVP